MVLAKRTEPDAYQMQALDIDTMVEFLVRKSSDLQRIILVIDALDKCKENRDLVNKLVKLYEASEGKITVLMTSRLASNIELSFDRQPQISISRDDVSPDIRLNVEAEVEKRVKRRPNWLRENERILRSFKDTHKAYILLLEWEVV